ncbi:MAG: ribosome silencing factor [Clostridia bacterium]|nr:ribosome silencing factor [Clostridia bacterium]
MEIIEKAKKIAELLDNKKAKDVEILDIKELTTLADYFVICSCGSAVQMRACGDEIEEKLGELGFLPAHVEGYNSGTWILMDYGDVVVHIFLEETRRFYDIERLWTDANKILRKQSDNVNKNL